MKEQEQEIPMIKKEHQCQAKETVETLTGKVDLLRRDMRTMERRHEDDVRKLWIRIAALTVTVAILTGNEHVFGWLSEVLGL